MSWLSELLKKSGPVGNTINAVGGGLLDIADPIIQELPVVGTIDRLGHRIGNYIPSGMNPANKTPTPAGVPSGSSSSGGGGFDWGNALLGGGLAGVAALRGSQSTDYAKGALKTAEDAYNAKAPLRQAGIAGMLNPSAGTPDLSSLAAIRGTNIFARPRPVGGTPMNAGPSSPPVAALPIPSPTVPSPTPMAPRPLPPRPVL